MASPDPATRRSHDHRSHTPGAHGDQAEAADAQRPADVFVIFGITGDLAKVMTFRSLYRLERRGLLDCPIVGVAVDDWTLDDLREHARDGRSRPAARRSTRSVFERFAARLSYVAGDFGDAATFERVAAAIGGRAHPGLLPRDPAVPVRDGRQGARRRPG